MENAEPRTTIHHGSVDDTLNAKSIPVITALKSPRLEGFFINRVMSHSVMTAEEMEIQVRKIARHPKKMNEAINAGIKAITTHRIKLEVVSGCIICGEEDK
jgi:hypothetical protein